MPDFNQPLGGNDMHRFRGPAMMMRLPSARSAAGPDEVRCILPGVQRRV